MDEIREIIVSIRKRAEEDDYTPDHILGQTLNYLADQLEFVNDKLDPRNGANGAAMRESLKHIVFWAGERAAGRMTDLDFLVNVQASAAAALGFPARNCDTRDRIDHVIKKFKSEVCDHYDNDWEDSRTQCSHDCIRCVMEWMLAKEGEYD